MSFSRVDESGDDLVAEINVTPLTDIFLVLLIIFMVTSTALTQQGTPVNLPRAGRGGSEPTGVIVTATKDRHIEVNGVGVAREDLRSALQAAMEKAGDRTVILRGDKTVILEDAVEIMTTAKDAGAERVAIATEPK